MHTYIHILVYMYNIPYMPLNIENKMYDKHTYIFQMDVYMYVYM